MYCHNCGNEVDNNAIVCVKCGVGLGNLEKVVVKGEGVSEGMLVAGYALAFIMPIIGAVIGVYSMSKGRPGHGVGMLVVALMSFFFWFGFFGG